LTDIFDWGDESGEEIGSSVVGWIIIRNYCLVVA